jgi:hypothetical protein
MKTIPKWGMAAAVLFVALAMLFMVVPVGASPDVYSCNFYGTAKVDGLPVGAGTEITAWLGVSQVASAFTGEGSLPDDTYSLTVDLDEAYDGATINFKIGTLWANETGTWKKMWFDPIEVNLTATTTPPTVTTNAASGITTSSAILNGNLDSLGGYSSVDVSFEWGGTSGGPYPNETTPETMTSTGPFSAPISGLSSNTTYYFRAKATGSVTVYGAERSFTTAKVPPAVTTNAASGITDISATLNGNLDSLGDYSSIYVSFEWGNTSGGPYPNETTHETMTSTGPFSATISGLASDTTYYFRAKATGSVTIYGAELSFITLPDTTSPTVVSTSPVNGAKGVPINTVVTATFSEPMDSSTITVDSFTLAGSAVSGTVTYNSYTYTAIFTPDTSLDYEHEYTATLSTAITDEAGNPLAEPYTWNFTTEEAPPEEEVAPARLIVRNLQIQPAQVYPGDQVTISADVVNQGGVRGSKNIELVINGQAEQSTRVGVDPGTAQHIIFTTSKSVPGTYEVFIEGQASAFNVLLRPHITSTGALGGLGTGAIIAIVVIGVIFLVGIIIVFIFVRRPV